MTHPELMTRIYSLAVEADENGFDITAAALLLLTRAGRLPQPIKRMLVNTGYMIMDATTATRMP
jgi:hypothetical protein